MALCARRCLLLPITALQMGDQLSRDDLEPEEEEVEMQEAGHHSQPSKMLTSRTYPLNTVAAHPLRRLRLPTAKAAAMLHYIKFF